jgi:hypothetical protein
MVGPDFRDDTRSNRLVRQSVPECPLFAQDLAAGRQSVRSCAWRGSGPKYLTKTSEHHRMRLYARKLSVIGLL